MFLKLPQRGLSRCRQSQILQTAPTWQRQVSAFLLGVLVFTSFGWVPTRVEAATDAYAASIEAVTYPKNLQPGQTSSVTVTYKNIGSATWANTGKNYVSIYRWDPVKKVELASQFATSAWPTNQQTTRLDQVIKPSQSVTLTFPIKAPSLNGTYKEFYALTAENLARMKYASFDISITVGSTAAPVVSAPSAGSAVPASSLVSAPVVEVDTAASAGWTAQLANPSIAAERQLTAEENIVLTVQMKNTGTQTWLNSGANYVSLYAVDALKKERQSSFKSPAWISASQVGKMKEAKVAPGQTGTFSLELVTPLRPDFYQETFMLAVEGKTWLSGSFFNLPIRVPISAAYLRTAPADYSYDTVAQNLQKPMAGYTATLMLRSAAALSLLGNGSQQINVGFKNTGDKTWANFSLRIKGVEPALAGTTGSVRDGSWYSSAEAVRVENQPAGPGELALMTFKVKAPAKKGSYKASFQLYANGNPVDGGMIDIPITVTADGYIEPVPTPAPPIQTVPSTPKPTTPVSAPAPAPVGSSIPVLNPIPLSGDVSSLPNEPLIRVGLYKTTDDTMVVRAKYVPLNVLLNGQSVCSVAVGASVTMVFNRSTRMYTMSGACSGSSAGYYIVRANDGLSAIEIADFARNDNTFRAQLELRFTPQTDSVWVINELPIEWYLKGIAETSNASPQEFQRTLLTTARTYAMYHVQRQTKHAAEYYTVDATYDQVYRGYGHESRTPTISAAVDATRGQIVTYAGKLAITPYFSRSDGRTRSWNEVWGGSVDWCVSVPVPWDQGKTLWGHGVGMSATGALGMANDGKKYDEILTYFYRGIELRKAYK